MIVNLTLLSTLRSQSENVRQSAKEEDMKVRNVADTGIQLTSSSCPKAVQNQLFLQLSSSYLKPKIPDYHVTEEINLSYTTTEKSNMPHVDR